MRGRARGKTTGCPNSAPKFDTAVAPTAAPSDAVAAVLMTNCRLAASPHPPSTRNLTQRPRPDIKCMHRLHFPAFGDRHTARDGTLFAP